MANNVINNGYEMKSYKNLKREASERFWIGEHMEVLGEQL